MSALREAAQQALEALIWTTGSADFGEGGQAREGALKLLFPSIATLRVTLKQEAEAAAWLAERKNHWRKEREKAQAAKDQDPELSAALGWPGGISNPVLDRVQLLQMVAALRVSAQQALEALEAALSDDQPYIERCKQTITALRAALAQQAEPVEPVAWMVYTEGGASAYVTDNPRDLIGAYRALPLYAAPPQRQPLTDEVAALTAQRDALLEALKDIAGTDPVDAALDPQRAVRIARAAIKAVEGENHAKSL